MHIRKADLKFACAHMTVFPDGSKERLHGHNYQTELTIGVRATDLANLIPFSVFKTALGEICRDWDERVLIQEKSSFFQFLSDAGGECRFSLCGKVYSLPSEEVLFLPIENTTSENLAEEILQRLLNKLPAAMPKQCVRTIEVRVEESPGQGASAAWENI